MLPGPQRHWVRGWVKWLEITGRWPFSPGALVKLASLLSSLSWPTEVADLGIGASPYGELLILH